MQAYGNRAVDQVSRATAQKEGQPDQPRSASEHAQQQQRGGQPAAAQAEDIGGAETCDRRVGERMAQQAQLDPDPGPEQEPERGKDGQRRQQRQNAALRQSNRGHAHQDEPEDEDQVALSH